MTSKSEKINEKNDSKSIEYLSRKLRCSMFYYLKSRQSYNNLMMFVMDV